MVANVEWTERVVCMLFTDIEGSTDLVFDFGDAYPEILRRHYELVRNVVSGYDGQEIRTAGDSVFALFPDSCRGVQAAIDAQRALYDETWPQDLKLKVRMGLHTGHVQRFQNDMLGIEVHRAARIGSVAHGGQIVISEVVREEIREHPFHPAVTIRDLGSHRLKHLRCLDSLFDLKIPGLPADFPPLSSADVNGTNLPSMAATGEAPARRHKAETRSLDGRHWRVHAHHGRSLSDCRVAAGGHV
jgi:class 3 adenylate cyclase